MAGAREREIVLRNASVAMNDLGTAPRWCTVAVDQGDLRLDGVSWCARSAVRAACRIDPGDRDDQAVVRVWNMDGVWFDAAVGSGARADALIECLGFSPRERAVTYEGLRLTRETSRGFRRWIGRPLGPAAPLFVVGAAALVTLAMSNARWVDHVAMFVAIASPNLALATLRRRQRVRMTIGDDGVFVESGAGLQRFVRFAEIDSTSMVGKHAVLKLSDGTQLGVSMPMSRLVAAQDASSVLRQIGRARAAAKRRPRSPGLPASLARDGRDARSWLHAAGERDPTGGYREAVAPTPDALLALALDPTESLESRSGAALALRPSLDDGGRLRVRASAQRVAHPAIRVLLDRVAEGDEEGIVEAIEGVAGGLERRAAR